jgi:hypothetical protein
VVSVEHGSNPNHSSVRATIPSHNLSHSQRDSSWYTLGTNSPHTNLKKNFIAIYTGSEYAQVSKFPDTGHDSNNCMFKTNPSLTTITFCQGKTGWPQTFNIGTFDSPVDLTTTSTVCAAPAAATPIPTSPLWLLGIMAGLLSLVGIRKLRKA